MNDNTPVPPCAGRWTLFDSTDLIDHAEAKALCRQCPIRLQCADELKAAREAAPVMSKSYGPQGTWAGELVGAGRSIRNKELLAAQDAQWSEREIKDAHAAHGRGDRSAWAVKGHRIYNRQNRRARQDRRAAA